MFKGLGNMASLVRQAQEMQGRVKEMNDRLGELRIEGFAGGVTVVVSGHQKVLSCAIDPALLSGDPAALQDLIVEATNEAIEAARETAQEELSKVSSGLNMPGLGEALSRMGLGPGAS